MSDVFVEFICSLTDFNPFPICFVEFCEGIDEDVGDITADAAAACIGGGTADCGGGGGGVTLHMGIPVAGFEEGAEEGGSSEDGMEG